MTLDGEGVSHEGRTVLWADLAEVSVVTTAGGPLVQDALFVLVGSQGSLVVSSTDPDAARLLDRLQALPGFRNEAVVSAMAATESGRFACWEQV